MLWQGVKLGIKLGTHIKRQRDLLCLAAQPAEQTTKAGKERRMAGHGKRVDHEIESSKLEERRRNQ